MAVVKVTISCPCGATLRIPHGDRQACECGRRWDTSSIPSADIEALGATVRRYRRNEIAFVMVALGVTIALMLMARSAPLVVVFPAFILAWVRWFRPWWRRRRDARLVDLPTWDLRPEVDG